MADPVPASLLAALADLMKWLDAMKVPSMVIGGAAAGVGASVIHLVPLDDIYLVAGAKLLGEVGGQRLRNRVLTTGFHRVGCDENDVGSESFGFIDQ